MRESYLGRLDVGLLLAFDALLRFENVSQAAHDLGISQPAMSTRLSRLRTIFADKLFVPSMTGRGIAPTPKAQTLRPQLTDVLVRLQSMVSPTAEFDPASSKRTFVIGLYRNPAAMLAPDLIPLAMRLSPNVRLGFIWPNSASLVEELESGAIDVILGSDLPSHGDLISRTLLEEPLLTAQRADHPRGREPFNLDSFCRFPHVIVSETGGSFSDFIDRELAALGWSRTVVASLQSYAVLPKVVERSDALSTLPCSFLARYGATLETFEPPLSLGTFKLVASWHPRLQEDAGHAWLRKLVAQVVQATMSMSIGR